MAYIKKDFFVIHNLIRGFPDNGSHVIDIYLEFIKRAAEIKRDSTILRSTKMPKSLRSMSSRP